MSDQPKPIKGASLSLKNLQNELHSLCEKWFILGVQLDIDYGTLKRIRQDCNGNVANCMVEVLIEWLKIEPTWKGIVEALRSPAIKERLLANNIERKYCLPEDVGGDGFCQKGDHSSQLHYSASFPANLPQCAPKPAIECRRSSNPSRLPQSETETQKIQKQLQEKDQQIQEMKQQIQEKDQQIQELKRHPVILPNGIRGSATVEGNIAYFRIGGNPYVYVYDSSKSKWLCIYPECPFLRFGIAVINGLPTAIGGWQEGKVVGTLLSLTGEGTNKEWSEKFYPMPTKRLFPGIVCCGTSLIVAGGTSSGLDGDSLTTVEVMNTENLHWTTARSLPHPFVDAWLTICGNKVYMLGGNIRKTASKSVFTCSLNDLHDKSAKWDEMPKVPVYNATCATVNGKLLAVGGKQSLEEGEKNCSAIYAFNPAEKSWGIKCKMEVARSFCLLVALPKDQLMIVGGFVQGPNQHDEPTNDIEIVSIL